MLRFANQTSDFFAALLYKISQTRFYQCSLVNCCDAISKYVGNCGGKVAHIENNY